MKTLLKTKIIAAILVTFVFNLSFCQLPKLSVHPNGKNLINDNGNTVFLNGDTGWNLPLFLSREDAKYYIETRKSQNFNLLAIAAIFDNNPVNFYGDVPFEKTNDSFDPEKPLVTKGNKPSNARQYDYWDNVDYILELAEKNQMYVSLVICFNDWVVGSGNGQDRSAILFNTVNSYEYGYFLGNRYKDKTNIIWMLGGDRSAVYGDFDYTAIYRAMAEGCIDGINGIKNQDGNYDESGILMSFHPQKGHPNSAEWFHNDRWLSFNSIQACPSDQEKLIITDYALETKKPVWLFEGRYEHYTYAYKAWQVRFQAYLSVFSGGFGHVYGNEAIWDFDPSWKTDLFWDGAIHMKYLHHIFTDGMAIDDFSNLEPNNAIILNGDTGETTAECWSSKNLEAPYSNRIVAMSTSDFSTVLVYSADGSTVKLNRSRLPEKFQAYWFDPRTGRWADNKDENSKKPLSLNQMNFNGEIIEFDLPGNPASDNDWIILIEEDKK